MSDNFIVTLQKSFTDALNVVLLNVVSFIPTFIGALLVFLIGIFLAKWLKIIVVKLLNLVKFSELIGHETTKTFLENAQISQKLEIVIGEFVRWVVILVFLVTSLNLLGLKTITQVIGGFVSFLPNILAALVILFAGTLIAGFLEKLVKGSLGGVDIKLSRLLGKFVSYLVFVFTLLATASQLGIAKSLIDTIFIGFIGMLALAFGLALGLGSKDLVKQILEESYKNFKKDIK